MYNPKSPNSLANLSNPEYPLLSTEANLNRNWLEKNQNQLKAQLIRIFCYVGAALVVISIIANIILAPSLFSILNVVIGVVFGIFCFGCNRLIKTNKIELASWLVIGFVMSIIWTSYLQRGTAGGTLIVGFVVPIVLANFLIGRTEATIVAVTCLMSVLLIYLGIDVFQLYTPYSTISSPESLVVNNLVTGLASLSIVAALIIVPISKQQKLLNTQNERLAQTLAQLLAQQTTSQEVSRQVLSLAGELSAISSQQSSGSQQQVAVVTQVNSAINELSMTTTNIAELAEQINLVANTSAKHSQQIEATTQLSTQQSEAGINAVEEAIGVSEEVATVYQRLLETMNDFSERSTKMRLILNLLGSIADETHLLSLNAAIEAAGAGQNGERFSVVAQEIKQLAARSRTSGQEIALVVRELQSGIEQIVQAANNGYAKANQMKKTVHQAGEVIAHMREVTEQAYEQSGTISQAVNSVTQLSLVIRSVTAQQKSSSQQVLEALQELSATSKHTAEGSVLVSMTASHLENLSQSLNQSFIKAA